MDESEPESTPDGRWSFWIDRGGTFTDVVARRPDGTLATAKVLSEDPRQQDDAALEGMRRLLGLARGAPIDARLVAEVRLGTTVATNALLQRRGERTLLVTTRGFGDALRIGTQARPQLFARRIELPAPLYERVIEAGERIDVHGRVLQPLDLDALRAPLAQARADGIGACAIVFMHAWVDGTHEDRAAALARELGFAQVSVSHRVSPRMKLVPRGDTTVVDAYLSPVLRHHVERLARQLPGVALSFMKSSGGLADAAHFRGKDAVLSGPAGGIVGMVRSGLAAGHRRLIGFDMGGTSTDVSHFAGEGEDDFERVYDTEVAGVRMSVPMMAIHTVAAGGGSIVHFDGGRLRVGPQSAGAVPGPACYRQGGPLTVTDANLLLGRISAGHFPRVFGPQGDLPPDRAVVVAGFERLASELRAATGGGHGAEEAAHGALEIAVSHMAHAIRRISVARGHDPARYVLQCFGGAGGQHACRVADALGIRRILIDPMAGVLSAWGIGQADRVAAREATVELPLAAAGLAQARERLAQLGAEARAELLAQDPAGQRLRLRDRLYLRYEGTDGALPLLLPAATPPGELLPALESAFDAEHRRRYGFLMPGRQRLIEMVAVEAIAPAAAPRPPVARPDEGRSSPAARVPMWLPGLGGGWREVPLWEREALAIGQAVEGPALVTEAHATTVVEPGWCLRRTDGGALELERAAPVAAAPDEAGTTCDPVRLELFNHAFMNVAEQMGLRLQATAQSVNIKERLDFSCALFDGTGELIANAPHIPVHLGSMGESIRAVIERNPAMQPGDAYVLNDPYRGGTHLPDITVVTPVFLPAAAGAAVDRHRPACFVASRGHHADIGGTTPGSIPPRSATIDEEGVLIDNFLLLRGGHLREAELRAVLAAGPWPARNPDQNLADLRAQLAANEKGVQELQALVAQHGRPALAAYMAHVQDNAEDAVRRAIGALLARPGMPASGRFELPMDNGALIRVAVRLDAATRGAEIDFTGTSAQLAGNFNAPRAVTTAAVLYVFRTLVDDEIPLNAGCLRPLRVLVPPGSLLDPRPPAAVVAGNVETSSCVTNALYGALGVMASAQCTMNNFTFGDARHQYYETIAGGAGAGDGYAGASVVQTHMTNSRLTDPEVLEYRFPVLLERFGLRAGSGGAGRWRGGEGAVRRLRFLAPMAAAIVSNGRRQGAFGLAGGAAGATGRNRVERADGRVEELGPVDAALLQPGDVFVIETPGGGGYGLPVETQDGTAGMVS